ncbi:MAG: hypothetical protein KJZ70_18020, partial [Bryobacterales bacterium]|nr:hypothetical protein [Bryobacterales bacterium]
MKQHATPNEFTNTPAGSHGSGPPVRERLLDVPRGIGSRQVFERLMRRREARRRSSDSIFQSKNEPEDSDAEVW